MIDASLLLDSHLVTLQALNQLIGATLSDYLPNNQVTWPFSLCQEPTDKEKISPHTLLSDPKAAVTFLSEKFTPYRAMSDTLQVEEYLLDHPGFIKPRRFWIQVSDKKPHEKWVEICYSLQWFIHSLMAELEYAKKFYQMIINANDLAQLQEKMQTSSVTLGKYYLLYQFMLRQTATSTSNYSITDYTSPLAAPALHSNNPNEMPPISYFNAAFISLKNTAVFKWIKQASSEEAWGWQALKSALPATNRRDTAAEVNSRIRDLDNTLGECGQIFRSLHLAACHRLAALQPGSPYSNQHPPYQAFTLTPHLQVIDNIYAQKNANNPFLDPNNKEKQPFNLSEVLAHAERLCGIQHAKIAIERRKKLLELRNTGKDKFHKGLALFNIINTLCSEALSSENRLDMIKRLDTMKYKIGNKEFGLFEHRHRWRHWLCWKTTTATEQKFSRMRKASTQTH